MHLVIDSCFDRMLMARDCFLRRRDVAIRESWSGFHPLAAMLHLADAANAFSAAWAGYQTVPLEDRWIHRHTMIQMLNARRDILSLCRTHFPQILRPAADGVSAKAEFALAMWEDALSLPYPTGNLHVSLALALESKIRSLLFPPFRWEQRICVIATKLAAEHHTYLLRHDIMATPLALWQEDRKRFHLFEEAA